jgi:TusA-related sulfurtransferase
LAGAAWGVKEPPRRLDGTARPRIPYPGRATEPKVFIPDKHIDCIGLFCPMPIVKTREAIQVMSPGELLAMLSDDPASDADMRSWCQITGHELLEVSRDAGVYRFLVRKNR